MSQFYVDGTSVHVFNDKDMTMLDALPVGTYQLAQNPVSGALYLEIINDVALPQQVYGNIGNHADRIMDTFLSKGTNMGVLLSGLKGTGKTFTAKLLMEKAREQGMPTVLVTRNFNAYSLADFFRRLDTRCVVLIDEFEKLYSAANEDDKGASQNGLLSLMDGVQGSAAQLYVLICNESNRVNQYMLNRPSRLYYHFRYDALDVDTVRAYCEARLNNKNNIQSVLHLRNIVREFSFDILQCIVEEMNRYDTSAEDALQYLNIIPTNTAEMYDVTVLQKSTGATVTFVERIRMYDTSTRNACSVYLYFDKNTKKLISEADAGKMKQAAVFGEYLNMARNKMIYADGTNFIFDIDDYRINATVSDPEQSKINVMGMALASEPREECASTVDQFFNIS